MSRERNTSAIEQIARGTWRATELTARGIWRASELTYRYLLTPTARLGARSTVRAARWANDSQTRYSRRQAIGLMVGSVAAAEATRRGLNHEWPFNDEETPTSAPVAKENGNQQPSYYESIFPQLPEQKNVEQTSLPFFDADANTEAKKLGLHAGNFFFLREDGLGEVYPKLEAFHKSKELLPIFPPSIIQHKEIIYKIADETGQAPNIIAFIMMKETGGIVDAESNTDNPDRSKRAQGLFGVMPANLIAAGVKDYDQMRDPLINGKVAMKVFNDYLTEAKRVYPKAAESYQYQRALMGYNGGYPGVRRPIRDAGDQNFANWESMIYGDDAMRFMIVGQVASQLREKGFSDLQIGSKMFSYEADARTAALAEWYHWFSNEVGKVRRIEDQIGEDEAQTRIKNLTRSYLGIRDGLAIAAIPSDRDFVAELPGKQPYDKYTKYLEQTTPGLQLNPALEVWASTTGGALFEQTINRDPKAWRLMDTKRPAKPGILPNIPRPQLPEIKVPGEVEKPKVPLMNQLGNEWKGDPNWDGTASCAPTTIAMILKAFGEDANPATVDKVFNNVTDEAMDMPLHEKGESTLLRVVPVPGKEGGVLTWLQDKKQYPVKKKSYQVVMIHDKKRDEDVERVFNYQKAKDLIDGGYLIVASGLVNWIPWAGRRADHVFGIRDVDVKNRKFLVFDPATGTESWRNDANDDLDYFHFSYALKPKS